MGREECRVEGNGRNREQQRRGGEGRELGGGEGGRRGAGTWEGKSSAGAGEEGAAQPPGPALQGTVPRGARRPNSCPQA